jgi:hypothetical protein
MKIVYSDDWRFAYGKMSLGNATEGKWAIEWRDSGREPQCAPDPKFPDGMDSDTSEGRLSCWGEVPYPAKRCGAYIVRCLRCGCSVAFTTAGRAGHGRCDLLQVGL